MHTLPLSGGNRAGLLPAATGIGPSLSYRTIVIIIVTACLTAGLPVHLEAHQNDTESNVVILCSDSLLSTRRARDGAVRIIERKHEGVHFHEFLVSPHPLDAVELVDSVKATSPDVILSIGSAATAVARSSFPEIPTIFAAVMYPELAGFAKSSTQPGANVTGASLNIPENVQFTYFKQIVPGLKRIGVLYTSHTASLIPSARVVAEQQGLSLVPILVESARDLPAALDSLSSSVDGIWSVADPELFTPQSTRYILLNTLRRGIPFMGFSRNVVESGALFALDFDYKAVGMQAGEIVNRVLDGSDPSAIEVTSADIIWFHYNERTAQHLDIQIPDALVAVAKEVYR